ncbi:type IV toxin-antitoxin system AbiEi family antitoxin [Flavobacterium ardleyense]|uniref:Type IV toxin-antitoxin system AbiEi family antitoxin n=1 Tax=Flavobacterium ardleyense TaxID=2038737 RepID=A0ABW5Z4W1_9FLAO
MTEDEIINQALINLEKLHGIKGRWTFNGPNELDGCLKLVINNNEFVLNAEIKKELRSQTLETLLNYNIQYNPFIIIAARIFPKIKTQLQQNNIAYLEANGNIYFNKENQLLWIDTNQPIKMEEKYRNRAYTKTGLKVVFAFLNNNQLIHQPYRYIAEVANTAVGNVTNIIKGLKEEGFVMQLNKNEIIFKNKKELLEKWTNAYEHTLKPTLKVGNFAFVNENNFYEWKNINLKETTVWGGEPAADLITNHLRPEKLTLYTTETQNELMRNYRLVPEKNGNVEVYKKFWKQEETNEDRDTAPAIVVYADLINTDDKRNRETAQMIYEQCIEQNL